MRFLGILAVSASFVLAAGPVAAQGTPAKGSALAATVEAYGGKTFVSFTGNATPDSNPDVAFFGFGARWNIPVAQSVSVQLDFEHHDREVEPDDNFATGTQAGLHLSYRNASGLVGAFYGSGTGRGDDSDSGRVDWAEVYGVEGQFHSGNMTGYLQAGVMDAEMRSGSKDDAFHDAWFVRAVGRYYPNATSRVQVELAYADGEQDSDDRDMYTLDWGVRYDRQISTSPLWSAFAAYRGGYYDNGDSGGDDGTWTEHLFFVGIRLNFGGLGIKANDRYGAGLDLPNYVRWAAAGDTLD